ncbi:MULTISPECIES: glycosyltransferase family 25 protein [Aeromonas]|uniref:Glycosyltransferase family 25 protein n=1 Tax=Aeromonas allosaccharophila TaxID=656 RepID=A0ABZ0FA30_9GAMM|nr:glycosyltransferase family 25 protein [Aeromonas allosaccharophila]WOE66446.1 glycosyltransferase family 25 protein [Aeromonas allosaccharophila]
MIPIIIVSLARSHERRDYISKQMHHFGLEFSFFDAVDGQNPSHLEEIASKIDVVKARELCGHDISLGEIGCAASHIKVYEMMVENNIDRAIILEDDVHLHMYFKELVESSCKKSSADIVFLRHGKAKSWPWKKSLPEGYRLAKYISPSRNSKRGIMSTAGYILTLNGAKKILKHAYPIRMPSDYLTGRIQLNGLSADGIEPCCLDVDWLPPAIDDRAYGHYLEQKCDKE